MEPKALKRGDACPRCGGSFKPTRVPTDAEYAKAFDRENPGSLPDGSDTASPEFRAEHGDLHRCIACGYNTRFLAEPPKTAPKADSKPDA
jgi:ribosomal protein S27AE